SGARFKLRFRGIDRQVAARAGENAFAVFLEQRARAGVFGALLPQNMILFGCQQLSPLGFAPFDLESLGVRERGLRPGQAAQQVGPTQQNCCGRPGPENIPSVHRRFLLPASCSRETAKGNQLQVTCPWAAVKGVEAAVSRFRLIAAPWLGHLARRPMVAYRGADMARDTTDSRPIEGVDELISYLADGCKPRDKWRIGTEHEKFPFYVDGNAPVPYGGERGIRSILEGMQQKLGWDPILDDGRIIGLVEPTRQGAISLAPGGQFEPSGAPLETIHQTCREGNAHLAQLREIAEPLGIRFLGLGGSPKWTLAETPRMPKSRYEIMTRYMPRVGSKGLDMMYRTCTIQVNLDFDSEADMRRKMQVSLKLQPVATALFANSPFTDGRPNGFLSWRGDIWKDTDNQRAGLKEFCFAKDFGFADYVEW